MLEILARRIDNTLSQHPTDSTWIATWVSQATAVRLAKAACYLWQQVRNAEMRVEAAAVAAASRLGN